MRIFVTGGTGFIGSYILNVLFQKGHDVIALRREGSTAKIPLCSKPVWLSKPLDKLDVHDLRGIDVLIHLASVGVSPQQATWEELNYWNVSTTSRLLELAESAGVRRTIIAGTFAEYGSSADMYEFIPVNAPLRPTSLYAASKAASCLLSTTFAIERKIELCWLRIFSAYGEGQYAGNFFPALRKAARDGTDFHMTLGEQVRDYVQVEAVAEAFAEAAENSLIVPGIPCIENIGSGEPVTMRQFAERWWSLWGAKGALVFGAVPYRPNESMRFVPELRKN